MERIREMESSGNTDCAEYRGLKQFGGRMPLCNYFMDKGWQAALEDFATAILNGRDFHGAKAFDGFQAARITGAAIRSRETEQPVKL